jgi:hypothetical protein
MVPALAGSGIIRIDCSRPPALTTPARSPLTRHIDGLSLGTTVPTPQLPPQL